MSASGKVTKRIMRHMRTCITDGTWKIGDRITSENEMCKELGVSRVSVRNAIQQFVSLGVLEVKHGKGTFLISDDLSAFNPPINVSLDEITSLADMEQLLQFRLLIEPSICSSIAEDASPELILRLESLLQTMRNSIGSSRDFIEADSQFHMEIANATGNPVTIGIMSEIFRKKNESSNIANLADGFYGGIYYHSLLIDVLKKHNSKKAFSIMKEHISHGIDELHNTDITENEEEIMAMQA